MLLKNIALAVSLVLSFALAGCDGGGDPVPLDEEENINAEGCEHLAEGPSAAVTAASTTSGTVPPPAISNDHKRYDIALVGDMSGEKVGVVTFAPREAADVVFFLSADVPLAIEDAAGAAVAVEDKQTSIPECTEVKARHQVELDVGTYYLRFGPTAEASVSVVVEEASGHEH